jgi:hypothetical protein
MRRRTVIQEVWIPSRSPKRAPHIPLVAKPIVSTACINRVVARAQGRMKGASRGVKDCARAGLLLTKELPDVQDQADAPSYTGHVGQLTTVMAMHTGGACPTERATGGRLCGNYRQGDDLISHITVDYFSFLGKIQEDCMFILSTTILPRVFPSLEHVLVTVLFPLFKGLDDLVESFAQLERSHARFTKSV